MSFFDYMLDVNGWNKWLQYLKQDLVHFHNIHSLSPLKGVKDLINEFVSQLFHV